LHGVGIALFRRFEEPFHGFGFVFWDANSPFIHLAEFPLCDCISLRGFGPNFDNFCGVVGCLRSF